MNALKEKRKAAGLTQKGLSERTGVDQSIVSKIETGALPLTQRMAETFSKVLECSPDELLGDDAVRTIVVSADGRKERPFRELFEAFIRSYEKPFNDQSLGRRRTVEFSDRNDLIFYDAMLMLLELSDRELGRVFRLIYDITRGKED